MDIQENQQAVDISKPPYLHLISAFLAMEPPDVLISLARKCGGGLIGERVQGFIWNNYINITVGDGGCQQGPYLKRVLKKLIGEIESDGGVVLDELYEHYAFIMTSLKGDNFSGGNSRVLKRISFLFPDECCELSSCPKSKKLEVSLHCSVDMLEGDTGCSIWPSSLYLSEFILSFPNIFSNRSCFEVGSGVGLVGVCLAHVKASAVVLSDGDLSTLSNMRLNLESNLLSTRIDVPECKKDASTVQCVHLPWESATEIELQNFAPDIIVGADVIYDPLYLPHLVRVLTVLLKRGTSFPNDGSVRCEGCQPDSECIRSEVQHADFEFDSSKGKAESCSAPCVEDKDDALERRPVAYIASVIRNIETFNYFLELMKEANLTVADITENSKPFDLLPYAKSYQRSTIRIFSISYN
ncbi:unnamed protein product [Coffea canephora]|uniref:FAM86 N-terminal domain-containing protein n=1 Tax=Coffea canephora TaxID=49390 RepID=A0A068VB49_COFCA|nr:unnamed protein product [Coffea canephora]